MNINRCELSGNVTRDGELKATKGGTPVLTFGLAFNDSKRNQQTGEWENIPNYIDCVAYGKFAESVAKHIVKGQKLFAAGKLHYSSWVKDGGKRSKIELIIDTLDLAGGRKQGEQQPAQQAPAYSAPPAPIQDDLYDEEIPF